MRWILYSFMVFGLILGQDAAFAKGDHGHHGNQGHGKHDGGRPQAVHVKQNHPSSNGQFKGNDFRPVRVFETKPMRVQYVKTGKPRFYSPYYYYSPYFVASRPLAVSPGFFTPAPKVLISPTIFTPVAVEPEVPTYYFFPPLYVPPRSLFSLNLGL